MNINDLIANVKKKLKQNINIENILIEDKTFLHKNHAGHDQKKFKGYLWGKRRID